MNLRTAISRPYLAGPAVLAALLLAASSVYAQRLDPGFGLFVPFGQLAARLDGQPLDPEMFYAERPGAYLLRSGGLEHPLLINVRTQKLERLDPGAIRDHANGTVNLLAGAVISTAGSFEVAGNQLAASLDSGHQLTLGPKPDLLGPQTATAIEAHDASYRYRAGLYPPSEDVISQLRRETRRVTVRVYFGSWCSTCARYLPWLMQVERALADSNVSFEYFGLPHTMDDPISRQAGVNRVPTAIVLADGKELGRRTSDGLGIPEEALLQMLGER